ncbi:U3 small nucleolar ribonucleoprotein complex, subunit Mpp10 like protein, partial [Aduncisulcus paluster]
MFSNSVLYEKLEELLDNAHECCPTLRCSDVLTIKTDCETAWQQLKHLGKSSIVNDLSTPLFAAIKVLEKEKVISKFDTEPLEEDEFEEGTRLKKDNEAEEEEENEEDEMIYTEQEQKIRDEEIIYGCSEEEEEEEEKHKDVNNENNEEEEEDEDEQEEEEDEDEDEEEEEEEESSAESTEDSIKMDDTENDKDKDTKEEDEESSGSEEDEPLQLKPKMVRFSDVKKEEEEDLEQEEAPKPQRLISSFERKQRALAKQINSIENELVSRKKWEMGGEVEAKERGVDSLLDVVRGRNIEDGRRLEVDFGV